MPASTHLLTDAAALAAPTAATQTKARNQGVDFTGMQSALQAGLVEVASALTILKNATDAADPQLTTITNMLLTLS